MATENRTAAVARIRDANGKIWGTGVLVSARYVLTCAHVVNDALGRDRQNQAHPPADTVITIDFPVAASGQTMRAKIVKWAFTPETIDIAGLELLTLTGHTGAVISAAFSPDGKTIVTASDDGTARIWIATTDGLLKEAERLIQRDPPELTPEERQRYLGE